MAAIMDIKFQNIVVEILIEHHEKVRGGSLVMLLRMKCIPRQNELVFCCLNAQLYHKRGRESCYEPHGHMQL